MQISCTNLGQLVCQQMIELGQALFFGWAALQQQCIVLFLLLHTRSEENHCSLLTD